MNLEPGRRLGPYEIIGSLGVGGMGEVYRARDTRLDREVAIKVLPPGLEEDEERRERFEREARTISQLNHPHICTLHDVGHEGGLHYLVMELLEGEPLADRLQKGPLPVHQVVRYGTQIAEALHGAHKQGVVHRDLKPGNIMLTRSGAKLLDFGLAKAAAEGTAPLDGLTSLPTEARPLTEQGTILGTFQYMAPEQLEGIEADARTDIFALGAVLYEMATGRRAFEGSSRTSLIAAIVTSQPAPLSASLPTPPALDHVVRKCLEKDPDDRWQSAHDVATELRWIGEAGSQSGEASVAVRRRRLGPGPRTLAAGLVGALLGGAAVLLTRAGSAPSDTGLPPLQFVIEYGDMVGSRPALSPDGQRVAYSREGALWVRDLRRLEPVRIGRTEGGAVPFWSPDGEWLGFTAEEKLWKIRLDGSGKTRLCSPAPGVNSGAAIWLPDGRIVFGTGSSGLYEVRDRGGDPRVVLEPGENEADFHHVRALPDGKGFLFVTHEGATFDNVTLWTGTERRTVLRLPGQGIMDLGFAPSGHIVFQRWPQGRGIWAVPFSLTRLEVAGEPFPVASFGAEPSVASNGTLAYVPDTPPVLSQILMLDRSGRTVRTVGAPRVGLLSAPALSPDGRRLVLPVEGASGLDLWLYDLSGGEPTRLTFLESPLVSWPTWMPAGDEVIFTWATAVDNQTVRATRVDGSRTVRDLEKGRGFVAVSADGRTLVYNRVGPGFDLDLWSKRLGDEGPGEALLEDRGWETNPVLSPDGRVLAYDKGGALLLRSFPDMGGPWQVASASPAMPRWSPRGDRLFFLSGSDMMEVEVATRPSIRVGTPRRLFNFEQTPAGFALGPDGESFIVVRPVEPPPGIVVAQNWLGSLE